MLLHLRSSRLELGVVSGFHLSALAALLSIELSISLMLLLALFITASWCCHCFSNSLMSITRSEKRGLSRVVRFSIGKPGITLLLGQQQACLGIGTHQLPVCLPRINYYSEFLIVLRLDPRPAPRLRRFWQSESLLVVIWPDSMSRADNRRLRRYLRFDCPQLTG